MPKPAAAGEDETAAMTSRIVDGRHAYPGEIDMRFAALALGAILILVPAGMTSAKVSDQKYAELREDAFGAAQGVIVSAAADALSNVALKFSQGSDELATLVRRHEELSSQVEAHRRQLERSFDDKSPDAAANQARIRK